MTFSIRTIMKLSTVQCCYIKRKNKLPFYLYFLVMAIFTLELFHHCKYRLTKSLTMKTNMKNMPNSSIN